MNVNATSLLNTEGFTSHIGEPFITRIARGKPMGVATTGDPGGPKYTPMLAEYLERLGLLGTTVEKIIYSRAQTMPPSPLQGKYEVLLDEVQTDVEECGLGALLRFWRGEVNLVPLSHCIALTLVIIFRLWRSRAPTTASKELPIHVA